jgi:AcrR family transcriptional regulator
MEFFSTRAYEDVWIEEVATHAGISRGLLYHYFPTKRDFYVAVTRVAAAESLEVTAPTPSLLPEQQLREGIDAFVGQAEKRSQGFLTAYRGALASDPEVRAIVRRNQVLQAKRILDIVSGEGSPSKVLVLAVQAWIAFAQNVIAHWLEHRDATREQVSALLQGALTGVVRAAVEADPKTQSQISLLW